MCSSSASAAFRSACGRARSAGVTDGRRSSYSCLPTDVAKSGFSRRRVSQFLSKMACNFTTSDATAGRARSANVASIRAAYNRERAVQESGATPQIRRVAGEGENLAANFRGVESRDRRRGTAGMRQAENQTEEENAEETLAILLFQPDVANHRTVRKPFQCSGHLRAGPIKRPQCVQLTACDL